MNSIVKEVTPLTRGIVWLLKDEANAKGPVYADIDYLLDGLLTANLRVTNGISSRVIVARNFSTPLYVMIVKELKAEELESYLSFFKDMTAENDILVIDEVNGFERLRSQFGKLSNHLRVIQ